MSKDREDLIEVMARGFRLAEWAGRSDSDWDVPGKVHEDNKEVWRDIARAALSAIEGAGFEIRLRTAPGEMAPPKPGDRVTVRTLVAHVEGNSFKPASGWYSTDLIVSNEGPNMSPTPPTTEEEGA